MANDESSASVPRLALPQVTLCAATSVNVAATISALEASLAEVDFADCKLFTDAPVRPRNPRITVVPIPHIGSSSAYSEFLLSRLVDNVETSHCLVAQWDGHVLSAERWQPQFLDYDFIGARWPQYDDSHNVGNGGFSLRSRRLMVACRSPQFQVSHPEDVAIGRINRNWLESQGMRFAPAILADQFATERAGELACSFGYHGIWHMPRAIGIDTFWNVYRGLDDYSTTKPDFRAILKDVGKGRGGVRRMLRMIRDSMGRSLKISGKHRYRRIQPNEED